MKQILVIGATGNVGRQVISQLASTDVQVRAMARSPESANLPPSVEVVRGDLTLPDTLDRCLEGVDAVFLVWGIPFAAARPAVERIARHARSIVFLSSPHQTLHPFFQQPNPVATLHAKVERLIEDSGLEWTFLRPGMFAINALSWWAPQIRAGDVVRWPYADAVTAPIHERDIAAVAARCLIEHGHAGENYVLTGPAALNHREQVLTIGDVIGHHLTFEEMPPETAPQEMTAFMPAFIAKMLLDAWAAAIGQPAFITSTVAEVSGMPPRTFRDWAVDHAIEFR
jgi:uncharacterized protein YbjT (DUF2867 family)